MSKTPDRSLNQTRIRYLRMKEGGCMKCEWREYLLNGLQKNPRGISNGFLEALAAP